MQLWACRGSYRLLLRAVQPQCHPEAWRTFATTPALQRSTRAQKQSKKKQRLENAKNPSGRLALGGVTQSMRKSVSSQDFSVVVASILHEIKQGLGPDDPVLEKWPNFERYVLNACKVDEKSLSGKPTPLRELKLSLQRTYLIRGLSGLREDIEYRLFAEDLTAKYSLPNLEHQRKVADLRFPAEWYGQARAMQRTIHLHVGPTNSGKTYHALKRLESCKNGFYAGPLRLLAQEVYQRFKASGVPCSLITGDDVQIPEGSAPTIVSNTVEMANLGKTYEVGVIDEIQMIADPRRGWAWTRAVLGARATELHLCGEARAVPLIRELAALTGDNLEIHRYERLNPLRVMDKSLEGSLRNLQKGDCVVAFSRLGIHALKADIEKHTGRRAAIVYGGLPAEIRTQQASLFNDPNNDYDYLVASDAIGMGLNLSIKRVVFETLIKRLPGCLQKLSVSEIKQIAGRAGRYRSAAQTQGKGKNAKSEEENVGFVTSLEDIDLPQIKEALSAEPPPITVAGLFPPDAAIQKFSAYFPRNTPFQYVLKRLIELTQVSPLFFMCDPQSQLENAELIDSVEGLRVEDQLALMAAPMHLRDPRGVQASRAFATCIAEHTNGRLLDIPELNLEVLENPVSGDKQYLHELEILHKSVILYAWLSFRIGGVFTDRTLASHVKQLVEERMVRALTEFSANKKLRKDASLRRQIALQKQIQDQKRVMSEANIDSAAAGELASSRVSHSSVPDEAPDHASDNAPEDIKISDDVANVHGGPEYDTFQGEGIPEDDLTDDSLPDDIADKKKPERRS